MVKKVVDALLSAKVVISILALAVLVLGLLLYFKSTPIVVVGAAPIDSTSEQLWKGYYTAEVHVRYHTGMAAWDSRIDTASKVVLATAAISAVVIAAFAANMKMSQTAKAWFIGIECAVTIASISVMLMNYGKSAAEHRDLAHQWQTLAIEWNEARDAAKDLPEAEAKLVLRTLQEREAAIEKLEPESYSRSYLRKKQREFNRFLGIADTVDEPTPSS